MSLPIKDPSQDAHTPAQLADWIEIWANKLPDGTRTVNINPADAKTIVEALRAFRLPPGPKSVPRGPAEVG